MTDDSKNKYVAFRNYMTNELGITRNDIEAWTKEAVAGEVRKMVGQMNITQMTESAVRNAIGGSSFNNLRDSVVTQLAKEITKQIKVSVST